MESICLIWIFSDNYKKTLKIFVILIYSIITLTYSLEKISDLIENMNCDIRAFYHGIEDYKSIKHHKEVKNQ